MAFLDETGVQNLTAQIKTLANATYAPLSHTHPSTDISGLPTVPSAGTTASAVGTTSSGGSATTYSKSDHVHNITSSTITTALGFTPYNSTNPNGYVTTDNAVTQTNTAATTNAAYRIVLSNNANDTTETTGVRKVSTLLYNPSQSSLYIGNPSGEHLTLGKSGITFDTGSASSSFGKTQIDNWNTAATWVTNNSTAALADTKVAQNNSTAANDFRVLLSNSVSDSSETAAANKSASLRFMPSTNHLYVGSAGQDALITVSPRMHLGVYTRYTQTGEAESSTSYGVGIGIDNALAYNSYLTTSALLFQHWNASRPSGGVPSSTNYVDSMCSTSNAHVLLRDYSGKDALITESELTSALLTFINSAGNEYTVGPTKISKWDYHTSNGNYSLTAATTQAVYPVKIDSRGHISAYGSAVTIPTASTATPAMNGTASYGSGTAYARSNHVHPTDTSRAAKDNFTSFTVSSTTTTKSLTSGHIYLLVTKRMNNSAAGGLYIVAPHTTTGSVTEAPIE